MAESMDARKARLRKEMGLGTAEEKRAWAKEAMSKSSSVGMSRDYRLVAIEKAEKDAAAKNAAAKARAELKKLGLNPDGTPIQKPSPSDVGQSPAPQPDGTGDGEGGDGA